MGELLQKARALHNAGNLAEAASSYRDILAHQPEHSDALHLLGLLELQSGAVETAAKLISRALALAPNNAAAHANLGTALMRMARTHEALAHYQRALQLNPRFDSLQHNLGTTLQLLGRHEEAAEAFGRLYAALPDADFALGNLLNSMGRSANWSNWAQLQARALTAVSKGRRAVRPFALLSLTDSSELQLRAAQTYAGYAAPQVGPPLWHGERYAHKRLRVAYVSADFRDHVVSRLMAPVYEHHDASQFETFGMSIGPSDDSALVERMSRALGQVIDASQVSDAEAAQWLRKQEIDIVIDLTGYTLGARCGILARRPAPLQVNYLGFPATMGVPWIDYLLADDFVVPPAMRAHYAEKVVCLPHCFQANYQHRTRAAAVSRRQAGLPEDAIVLCCFNQTQKINPTMLDVWARVLCAAPASILWLLAEEAPSEQRLREHLERRGVESRRLHFATRCDYDQHLERLALADLFLDTLPFNAGASAADALWAGVPVLTCAGEALAARMAASLLRTLGLTELICTSLQDYETLAVALASDARRRSECRTRLLAARGQATLFDSQQHTRYLEAAYRHMSQLQLAGERPRHFSVTAEGTVSSH
jgi:predicted O-linked N-acetylglucosamine transferase (SPINDLY family)